MVRICRRNKQLVFAIVSLWLLLQLPACTPSVNDPSDQFCGVGATQGCTESVFLGDTLRVRTWDPDRRRYADLLFVDSTIVSGKSSVHWYNRQLKDSVVYWVNRVDSADTGFSGYGVYQYTPAGALLRVILHDSEGNPFQAILYDSLGQVTDKFGARQGETGPVYICSPYSGHACTDEDTTLGEFGDTLKSVRRWDPVQLRYYALAYRNGYLLYGQSYVHDYMEQGGTYKDSVVYWVSSIDSAWEFEYYGRGEYEYENGMLVQIVNYNTTETLPYGYVRYYANGVVREEKVDGHIVGYTVAGERAYEYFLGSADTTRYAYDLQGVLVRSWSISNGITRWVREFGTVSDSIVEVHTLFDSAGILSQRIERDSLGRDRRSTLYLPTGDAESITVTVYRTETGYARDRVVRHDGNQVHLETIWYDSQGRLIAKLVGTGEPVTCSEPLSYSDCIPF